MSESNTHDFQSNHCVIKVENVIKRIDTVSGDQIIAYVYYDQKIIAKVFTFIMAQEIKVFLEENEILRLEDLKAGGLTPAKTYQFYIERYENLIEEMKWEL